MEDVNNTQIMPDEESNILSNTPNDVQCEKYKQFMENQDNIYPLIRNMNWSLSKPFINNLNIVFFIDDGQFTILLDKDKVSPSVSVEQVYELALSNLMNMIVEHGIVMDSFDWGGFQMSTDDQHYSSSLILSPNTIHSFAEHIGGNLVFSIPQSETFLIVPQADPELVSNLKIVTTEIYSEARKPLSDKLYEYNINTKEYSIYEM